MSDSNLTSVFDFDKFKDKNVNTSSFLDSFATQYGFDFGQKEDNESDTSDTPAVGAPSQEPANDGLTLSQRRRAARDLQKLNRDARVNTQKTTRQTNANAQDFIRGGLSGDLQQERQIFTQNDASDAVASEINQRVDSALTDATASDPFDNRPDQSGLDIYSQSALKLEDVDVNERLTEDGIDISEAQSSGIDLSGIATEDDLTTQRAEVDNTLTSVTKNDPGVSNLGADGSDTSGLAIYDQEDDTSINVGERLADLDINPGESQYTDRIDAGNEVESEVRARQQRQEDAYQANVENDPSDAQRGMTGVLDGYNPPPDSPEYNPGDNLGTPNADLEDDTWEDRFNDSYMPDNDLGIGDEADQRGEPTRVSRDSSGTPHPDGHTGLPNDPVHFEPTPIERIEAPPEDNVSNAINLMRDGDDRGAWNMLRRTVGLEEGTDDEWNAELANRAERDRIAAERQARNSETAGRSQTLDMNTMQPIGRQGVVNDETTNVQQEGSSASAEIDVEAETRENQMALQSNEVVASGGSDTALMMQPDAEVRTADFQDSNNNGIDDRDEEWHKQGFKDEAQMGRFEKGYADYLDTARRFNRNINEGDKDKYKKAFFDIHEPAYEYDQKAKAHNAIIDEAKQRGVDTGVFKNVGEVNKWIGRLNKKQAGKFVGYSNEAKENYLIENKLDTMKYNQF